MPTSNAIEASDYLTQQEASRLQAVITASDYYRENLGSYPDLHQRLFGYAAETTLTADLSSSATTASVAHTINFPGAGILQIESEFVLFTGKASLSFTGLTRGALGSVAAAHLSGVKTRIYSVLDAQHLSALANDKLLKKDDTVSLKGGSRGLDFNRKRDREELAIQALGILYPEGLGALSSGASYAGVAVFTPISFCPRCNCPGATNICPRCFVVVC